MRNKIFQLNTLLKQMSYWEPTNRNFSNSKRKKGGGGGWEGRGEGKKACINYSKKEKPTPHKKLAGRECLPKLSASWEIWIFFPYIPSFCCCEMKGAYFSYVFIVPLLFYCVGFKKNTWTLEFCFWKCTFLLTSQKLTKSILIKRSFLIKRMSITTWWTC